MGGGAQLAVSTPDGVLLMDDQAMYWLEVSARLTATRRPTAQPPGARIAPHNSRRESQGRFLSAACPLSGSPLNALVRMSMMRVNFHVCYEIYKLYMVIFMRIFERASRC